MFCGGFSGPQRPEVPSASFRTHRFPFDPLLKVKTHTHCHCVSPNTPSPQSGKGQSPQPSPHLPLPARRPRGGTLLQAGVQQVQPPCPSSRVPGAPGHHPSAMGPPGSLHGTPARTQSAPPTKGHNWGRPDPPGPREPDSLSRAPPGSPGSAPGRPAGRGSPGAPKRRCRLTGSSCNAQGTSCRGRTQLAGPAGGQVGTRSGWLWDGRMSK